MFFSYAAWGGGQLVHGFCYWNNKTLFFFLEMEIRVFLEMKIRVVSTDAFVFSCIKKKHSLVCSEDI